ncbi:MAG: hypothetical protein K0R29_1739 [Pseudobdellovibrio sp.]|jgi:hypothetical protein|nr:hypothetical protein [Pseudobdellovibrio sp.]
MTALKYFKLILILVLALPLCAAEEGEENPLVADTFTKKKHVRKFAPYETVVINYLEGGEFQASVAAGAVIQKVSAASTNASPIAYSIDSNGTKYVAGVAAKYGISDYLSAAVQLTYANGDTTTDSVVSGVASSSGDKLSGIEELGLRGQLAIPFNSFGYLADIEWDPSIGTAASNAQTDESNAYREQSSLALQNYIIFNSADVKWGGLLSYVYRFDGQVEQTSSTGTKSTRDISGGNTLEAGAFTEFEKLYNLYLQVSYAKSDSSTRVTSAGAASETPALDFVSVLGSVKINISRSISLVPQFQYATLINKDADPTITYSQTDIFGVNAVLRMLF